MNPLCCVCSRGGRPGRGAGGRALPRDRSAEELEAPCQNPGPGTGPTPGTAGGLQDEELSHAQLVSEHTQ